MKYIVTIFSVCSLLLVSVQISYAYRTKGVVFWPLPYYPGIGVFQVTDYAGVLFNKVRMKVYDMNGEQIASGLFPGYPVIWNGRNSDGDRARPGVYTVKIEAENVLTGLHGIKTSKIMVDGRCDGAFTGGGWVGTRYIAMGRSGEVTADDVYSIYWNPAGLTELRHTQLLTEREIRESAKQGNVEDIDESELIRFSEEEKSFSVQAGLSGTMLAFGNKTGFAGMAVNLPTGVFGFGVYTNYSGGIDRRDFNGIKTGTLTYTNMACYLSYGASLGVSSLGISVKGLYEKVGNTSYLGCGVDVGTQVYVLPFLKVGLMVQDLGTGMYPLDSRYYIRETYTFAYPTLKLGIAVITNRNFTLSVSGIKKLDRKTFDYSIGAQYDIMKWASVHIGLRNLVFSAGLTFHVVQFDAGYAFTIDTITKGFSHTISATVLF
ncbi:MAG: hypothetical protein JW807_09740 [Spirochaetes bacterium]|nr:hypothetical protein [Spirochaetota bacterium]